MAKRRGGLFCGGRISFCCLRVVAHLRLSSRLSAGEPQEGVRGALAFELLSSLRVGSLRLDGRF